MTTSRIVMPRGRVSMKMMTLATSAASSRLPDSLASCSFSAGQSAMSAVMTGPGEVAPTSIVRGLHHPTIRKFVQRSNDHGIAAFSPCRRRRLGIDRGR
jgi:hypothetical protein